MNSKTTWWSSSARSLVYTRWGFLVLMNCLFPLLLSFQVLDGASQFIGVVLAIASFVVIYAEFDLWLISKNHSALSRQLRVSAAIKIGTPLLPFIDMLIGLMSMSVTNSLTGFFSKVVVSNTAHPKLEGLHLTDSSSLLEVMLTYITTMINGILLTLLVGLILFILRVIQACLAKRSVRKTRSDSATSWQK